jgi:hypothetical protein
MPDRPAHERARPRAVAKPITEIIAELRAAPVAELVERYEEVFATPPRVKHRDWLWRRIAWKVQEQRIGGLSQVAKRRLDELIEQLDVSIQSERRVRGQVKRQPRPGDPPVGTILSRVWRDQEVLVTAVDGGWEHEGVLYRSLSAVAKAVTGSHWNGRLFFGLTKRRTKA